MCVAGIRGTGINQSEKRHRLTLCSKLLGHFIGHVPAEAITPEVIRPLRLELPQISNILRRHIFNAGKLLLACQGPRAQCVDRLGRPEMAGQIRVAPEHSPANAVHKE